MGSTRILQEVLQGFYEGMLGFLRRKTGVRNGPCRAGAADHGCRTRGSDDPGCLQPTSTSNCFTHVQGLGDLGFRVKDSGFVQGLGVRIHSLGFWM